MKMKKKNKHLMRITDVIAITGIVTAAGTLYAENTFSGIDEFNHVSGYRGVCLPSPGESIYETGVKIDASDPGRGKEISAGKSDNSRAKSRRNRYE